MTISEQHTVTLDGRSISYALRRSNKARYARLEVGSESGLTVIIPARYQIDRVRLFLVRKHRWITEKLGKYGYINSAQMQPTLKPGDTVPFLGKSMRIETRESPNCAGDVFLNRQTLVVSVSPGNFRISIALEKWYREEAKKKIRVMVDGLCGRMGLSYNRLTLKGQKSIWGSCSPRHNLNFNWRLMMTPEPVIEYVLIHELAHLKEMNHSPRFWKIVEQYCPCWRDHRRWLREHARDLSRTLAA
jgi:predicted metal-dependent hydrolase